MLNVIYRTYPGYNDQKSLISFKEKKDLIEVGFSSLLESLKDIKAFIHIVVDNPTNEYLDLLKSILSNYKVESTFILREAPFGNQECFGTCLDIIKNIKNSYIFFCEDDYLLNKSIFKDLMSDNKLNTLYYIFPYQHPDYTRLNVHKIFGYFKNMKSNKKYKRCLSGCLTFFTNSKTISKDIKIFNLYTLGLGDHNLWKVISLPVISSYTIFKEIFNFRDYKFIAIKQYLLSIIKFNKAKIYYTEKSYSIQLSNDCLPVKLELLKFIDDKDLFLELVSKEFNS